METKKWILLLFLSLALIAFIWAKRYFTATAGTEVSKDSDLSRASELVTAYCKSVGIEARGFNENGDVSFGDFGFQYDRQNKQLIGRVYITMARTKDDPDKNLKQYEGMLRALNDPKIGGMFDTGGGSWILDKEKEAWFLVKAFDLKKIENKDVIIEMNKMFEVAGVWTTEWFYKVAMIFHHHESAPTHFISIEEWRGKADR